ncbi:MAG: hypothetical protein ABEH61_00290 [Haloarculaceae archaeon]
MGDSGETTGKTQDSDKPKAYRFFFKDEADSLGNAADTEIPEDASKKQVVVNDRTEEEWQEMQLNDHHYTQLIFDQQLPPYLEVTEGSVQEIEQKTVELYQKRQDSQEFQDQHNAEIFTESVLDAVLEVTNADTGPAQSEIVRTVADHIAHTNDQIEVQNYKLSSTQSIIGDAGGDRFTHPMGLLQYQENGETHVRYAETENRYTDPHAEPENSVYGSDPDKKSFQTWQMGEVDPIDWATVFDYDKIREMEERGKLNEQSSLGRQLSLTLIQAVDDAGMNGYDMTEITQETGVETVHADQLIDSVISDSLGKSLQNYVRNPGEEYTRDDFEDFAKQFYLAAEAEDFGGHFIMKGDLANPEIYKKESETLEEIRADMNYSQENIEKAITG